MQAGDTLFTGTSLFLNNEESNAQRFPTKPLSKIGPVPVQFKGIHLSKTPEGFQASQSGYVEAIFDLDTGTLVENFVSLRGNIAYAKNQTFPLQ